MTGEFQMGFRGVPGDPKGMIPKKIRRLCFSDPFQRFGLGNGSTMRAMNWMVIDRDRLI